MTGFLGGFTTFSAFAAETMRLAEQQSAVSAGANVIANLAVGLGAAVLGLVVARGY
jgi:CrcB protein